METHLEPNIYGNNRIIETVNKALKRAAVVNFVNLKYFRFLVG